MARIVLLKNVPTHLPGTTPHFLRTGFITGQLPGFRIGNPETGRIAFDLDILQAHIEKMALQNIKQPEPETQTYGQLRKVR